MTSERDIVLLGLIEIIEKNQYSHLIEKDILDKYDYLGSNEKAFIKKCMEGTIEKLIPIDEVLNEYSKTPVNKMKPLIRTLLRMSVYQLLYMDRVPDSAVCNEAVKLATKHGFNSLKGYVNGVLRNIARNKKSLDIENKEEVPQWLIEHFNSSYGEEIASKILDSFKRQSKVYIRARRSLKDTSMLTKVDGHENFYTVNKGIKVSDIPGYEEGDFIVQDVNGASVGRLSGIKEGDLVLDVCASPGAKSISACDLGGIVTSRDVSENKVARLLENARRCGIKNMTCEVFDAREFDPSWENKADVVIADLPCSGLGVIGRKSDIRFKQSKDDLDSLVELQKSIIDVVVRYVKEGGVLIYSTCTLNPKENEDQARYIASRHGFILEEEKQYIPGVDIGDGFYVARLRKNNG